MKLVLDFDADTSTTTKGGQLTSQGLPIEFKNHRWSTVIFIEPKAK